MAIDNEECDEWMEKFGEKLPFAAAVRNYRRINALLKKLQAMQRALIGGRYYGGMLYAGAHTRRFSGSGGNLNLQNLPRGEMFGVHLRNLIKAEDGMKLVVVDLSQIEVRTVIWLSGDKKMMEVIRNTDDIYEAFGIAFGLWDKAKGSLRRENPKLRQMLKIIGLGVLYGATANKVSTIAKCAVSEAANMVRIVKRTLRPVVRLWRSLDTMLVAGRKDGYLQLDLPSGNSMVYRDVKSGGGKATVATIVKNGRPIPVRLWFGSLVENISQALARDIFVDRLLEVEAAGYPAILHVHDEVVLYVPEDQAEQCLEDTTRIMSTPPNWIPDIALDAEGQIMNQYDK
jgi:DNA polymerase